MPRLFDHLRCDLRDATRSLARRPAFTAVALISFAIGIGCQHRHLHPRQHIVLRRTPIEAPERVVNVYLHQSDFPYSTLSHPEVRDLRDGTGDAFTHIGGSQIRSIGEAPRDMVYRSYLQHDARGLTVVARTSRDAQQTMLALMAAGRSLDPDLWVWETKTLARHLALTRLPAELSAFILGAFAVLALLLASIGLYGVVSYAAAQRTREISIRVALVADPASVVRLVAFDGLRLVFVGGVLGMAAALGVMQLLSGLLFGGRAFDPLTLVVVPLILGASASLAAYLPARRVRRIDPMLALRAD